MKITIKNIEITEVETLKSLILRYSNYLVSIPKKHTTILITDVCQSLFYYLRNKLEKTKQTHVNININPTQAVILLQVVSSNNVQVNDYEYYVKTKFTLLLDKQLAQY